MVMVTGITCGAAVTAITTVGTEAADIIMDGTRADIADGIHNMRSRPSRRWGGLVYHGTLFNERDQFRQSPCAARSPVAAASAAAVRPPSVMSPRSAHLRIFLAIRRRTRCSSAPMESPLQARSRATSILASVRESKFSAIMTVLFIELQQSLQA